MIPLFILSIQIIAVFSAEETENGNRRQYLEPIPQLPEVIDNRALISSGGYHYPIPNPPVQFDDPIPPSNQYLPPVIQQEEALPPVIPTYLPPGLYPPLGTPPPDLSAPQFDPLPTQEIPVQPPANSYLPPSPTYLPPPFEGQQVQLRVSNMSCLDSATKRFFAASLRASQFLEAPPVIDDAKADCIVGSGNYFRIDMEGNKMGPCGVRYCDKNLCLTVRMPTVRGLRLPEDYLVTLQCKPQESVVERVKHLKLSPQFV